MNKRLLDFIRMVVASPELLTALIVVLLIQLNQQILEIILAVIDISDSKTIISILSVPIVMTLGAYKICSEILNPTEHKTDLYAWPNFWLVRGRIQLTLAISVISSLFSLIGVGLILTGDKYFGVVVITASWAALAVSIIHAVLAKMALTEILNTPPENL